MSNSFDKAWYDILENFDWVRVHKTMGVLEWKYVNTDPELTCPSVGTLVKTAQGVCKIAWDNWERYPDDTTQWYCATGGFEAEVWVDGCDEPQLRLQFVVTEWESYSE